MLAHWYQFLSGPAARMRAPTHVLLARMERREVASFLDLFGLFTPFCYRRAASVSSACFCGAPMGDGKQSMASAYHAAALRVLGARPPARPGKRVGIIARRNKRFILNEGQLVDLARAKGFQADVLPLEAMTVHDQITKLRTTDLLFGVHGSGLSQAMWLPHGARAVQWVPQGINMSHAQLTAWFRNEAAHVKFVSCFNTRRKLSVRSGWRSPGTTSPYAQDATTVVGSEFFFYWVNQDSIVPADVFEELLRGQTPSTCVLD